MTKKQKKPDPKKTSARLSASIKQHRWIAGILLLIVLLAASFFTYRYSSNQDKFSDNDYAALSSTVTSILKASSSSNVSEKKTCKYVAPGVYDRIQLFCGISLVSYIDYQDEKQAVEVAKRFDHEIASTFTNRFNDLSDFYSKPSEGSATTTVTLGEPFPKKQCNFYIESNKRARTTLDFDRLSDDANVIALSFECSVESRAEYFPVIYRQGK